MPIKVKQNLPARDILENENIFEFNILEIINNSLNKNYKSIAVICKNQPIVEEVRNNLSKIIDFDKTNENNQNSINSICCTSSYLSKVLEFDL